MTLRNAFGDLALESTLQDVKERLRGEARVLWGEAISVQPGETVTVCSLVGEEGLRIKGFSATGTGDGRFRLLIDTAPLVGGTINGVSPGLERNLLTGVLLPAGSTALVQVFSQCHSVSDFEASIYAEVTHG